MDILKFIDDIHAESSPSKYYFLACLASSIVAQLGLLTGSIAVIVGSMLISPLMGPLICSGMSFAAHDYRKAGVNAFRFLAGFCAGLAGAYLICKIIPLSDATSEILARTKPNLIDLAVALTCGYAASFAKARKDNTLLVGCAIATSLMPPTAVVAYGLHNGLYSICTGALMLLFTNAAAIVFGAALGAAYQGFGRLPGHKVLLRHALLGLLTLAPAALLLAGSLQEIAEETRLRNAVQRATTDALSRLPDMRVSNLKLIHNEHDNQINMTLIGDFDGSSAEELVKERLEANGIPNFSLNITKIPNEKSLMRLIAQQPRPTEPTIDSTPLKASTIASARFGVTFYILDGEKASILVPKQAYPISTLRLAFQELANANQKSTQKPLQLSLPQNYPKTTALTFDPSGQLDQSGLDALDDLLWIDGSTTFYVYSCSKNPARRFRSIQTRLKALSRQAELLPCPSNWDGTYVFGGLRVTSN